jgi:hypothetical protein
MTLKPIVAIVAAVLVLASLATGNAVPAAIVFIAYVAWLPIRDRLDFKARGGPHRGLTRSDLPWRDDR